MDGPQPSVTIYYLILGAFFALLFFSSWITLNVFVALWRKSHVDMGTDHRKADHPYWRADGLGLLRSGRWKEQSK